MKNILKLAGKLSFLSLTFMSFQNCGEGMKPFSVDDHSSLSSQIQPGNTNQFSTLEDTNLVGQVQIFKDPNQSINYEIRQQPSLGKLILFDITTGKFEYKPNENVFGNDEFSVVAVVIGSNESSTPHSISIKITPVNDLPIAMDGQINVSENIATSGKLSAQDVDNDTLTFEIVTPPTKGSIENLNPATGEYAFAPTSSVNGSDSFTFRAKDGEGYSSAKTITVNLNHTNKVPIASNRNLTTNEDTSVNGQLMATDADGDRLSYRLTSQPSKGTIQNFNAATGSFVYVPKINISGTDSFQYVASDGSSDSVAASVNVNIVAINDAPISQSLSLSTNQDTALVADVIAMDVDGDALTYSVVNQPLNGTVQFINGKSFRYTPNTNYSGSDTFTYRANDGKTNSNIASVSITIIAAEVVPGMVQLSWDTNTEPDLAGYKVYMRTQGSQYGSPVILSSPTIVNQRVVFEVQGLDKAEIHYFVVSAYDQSGNESEFSVEVSKAF